MKKGEECNGTPANFRHKHNYRPVSVLLCATLAISGIAGILATGGGGGGGSAGTSTPPTTAIGRLVDGPVAGLSYTSGGQSGLTGADGSFTYEVGKTVTFKMGGLTIGSVEPKEVITPVDLVSGGDSSNETVQNIARFFMAMDDNNDETDGIQITADLRNLAATWTDVDFSTDNLAAEMATQLADAATANSVAPVLPSAADAKTHIESSFRCEYSGGFYGTWQNTDGGTDSGTIGIMVDAQTGAVSGGWYLPSSSPPDYGEISGITAVSADQVKTFSAGAGTLTWAGSFSTPDSVSGTYEDTSYNESGTFTGTRVGGSTSAVYRYTGYFSGNQQSYGLLTFDVDSSGTVTGNGYDIVHANPLTISGTLNLTTGALSATATDQIGSEATVIGTVTLANHTLTGTFSTPSDSGTFTGNGCVLNPVSDVDTSDPEDGASFSTADLEGTWQLDGPCDDGTHDTGPFTFSSNGSFTATMTDVNHGDSWDESGSATVASNGTVTLVFSDQATLTLTMNETKDEMTGTNNGCTDVFTK